MKIIEALFPWISGPGRFRPPSPTVITVESGSRLPPILRLIVWGIGFMVPLLVFAQSSSFAKLGDLFIEFRASRGKLLFPEVYQKFQPYLKDEGHRWQRLSPEDQQKLLRELSQWVKRCRKAEAFVEPVLSVREAALQAGAEDFAEELFTRAETSLQKAASWLDRGRRKKAQEALQQAQSLYQQAEREAIRNNLLGQAQILIQESIDLDASKFTPRSLALTRQLLQEVERLIQQGPANNTELSLKNEQLAEAAQHLLFLTQLLNRLYETPENAEAYFLELEERIKELGESAGYSPLLTRDYGVILQEITQAVQNLNQTIQQLRNRVQELQQENYRLMQRLQRHQTREEQLARIQKKIEVVQQIFRGGDAQILADTSRIRIRINGIAFAPGSATIPTEAYPTLNRLTRAILEFPLQMYRIEVIQPTAGNLKYSENLARLRAKAVQTYLQATLPIPDDRFEIVGQAIEDGPNPRNKIVLQFHILLK